MKNFRKRKFLFAALFCLVTGFCMTLSTLTSIRNTPVHAEANEITLWEGADSQVSVYEADLPEDKPELFFVELDGSNDILYMYDASFNEIKRLPSSSHFEITFTDQEWSSIYDGGRLIVTTERGTSITKISYVPNTNGQLTITVESSINGTVSAPAYAAPGAKVTLTVTPDAGYQLKSLTVTFTYTLSGVFTVSDPDGIPNSGDEKNIHFSQGNLVATIDATGAPTAWKFLANQYDCLGEGGANKTIGAAAGDVDLFGWSTSTNSGTSTTDNYGIKTSTTASDYSGDFYDWGKAVGDGNTWHTLSKDEWTYLLNNHSKKWVTVNDVNGLVIAPDGFEGTLSDSYADEAALAANNLVFLPAAGYRNGSDVNLVGEAGCYWSSSVLKEQTAYGVGFGRYNVSPDSQGSRVRGQNVRLVTEVKAGDTAPVDPEIITPEKQQDGTYQFTMPAANVTVTAEFKLIHEHAIKTTHAKVEGKCEEAGHETYYECSCGKYFSDQALTQEIENLETWLGKNGDGYIAPIGHDIVKVNGTPATEDSDGFKDAYKCNRCGKYFEDEQGTKSIGDEAAYNAWKLAGGKIEKLDHDMVLVSGAPATQGADGFKDAYKCNNCGKYFEDEAGTKLIGDEAAYNAWKLAEGKIPALDPQKENGLNGGAIAGIVIGSVFGLLIIAFVVLYILWKRKNLNVPLLCIVLTPAFRFINKLFFKTKLNDVEAKEAENKAMKE